MSPEAKLPLGSLQAKKSISKLLTYYIRGGKQFVRRYIKPSGPASTDQLAQREIIKSRVEGWQALSPSAKAEWNAQAKSLGQPWSGYTLYMTEGIMDFKSLSDTFSSFSGHAGKQIQINSSEDKLEPAFARPLIFDSGFDDLALGNINGQGTYPFAGAWQNVSGADCTAEIIADPSGGKMLRLHDRSGTNLAGAIIYLNAGNEVLTGVLEWKMKVAVQASQSRGYFFFKDGLIASNQGGYFRGDAADLYYRTAGGGTAKLCNAAIGTWYIVRMYMCRLANYAVWWVDDVFTQSRTTIGAGNKFDNLTLKTRDTYNGQDFDIKHVKIWSLNQI